MGFEYGNGGVGYVYVGGGGGGGSYGGGAGAASIRFTSPSVSGSPFFFEGMCDSSGHTGRVDCSCKVCTDERTDDMDSFINEELHDAAREHLEEKAREAAKEKAVDRADSFLEFIKGCDDGETLLFSKAAPTGDKVYHYAIVKSGGLWYRTNIKIAMTDDELVVFLVSLDLEVNDVQLVGS